MAGQHGGRRQGAGRPRKQRLENRDRPVVPTRIQERARLLEQQRERAIARGRLATAARIEAKRMEFINAENEERR